MSEDLIKAAVRACVVLSGAIEAAFEAASDDQGASHDAITEIRPDLVSAYNLLTDQLSVEIKLDARKLVRDLMVADVEASRAVLRAMGVL
jgi:hypothetical protein